MKSLRWVLATTVLAVALSSHFWGPDVLSRITWFDVQRVEVAGNRYLAPHDVLSASGVRAGQSVWDDAAAWETALRAHPGIEEARVVRRLPATLRVRIQEKRPVAYVLDRSLLPATAAGEIFPVDPSSAALDLPIVHGPWTESVGAVQTRAILTEVGRLEDLDPGLLADVSEIRAASGQPAVLVLSHRLGEILLPMGVSSGRLAELRAVLLDLDRRGSERSESRRPTQVDVRYEAQIVVRLQSSV
ncbi:hypothetical protein BH23GEM6_BH23GEM6_09680 [soil metagenome]